MKKWNLILAMMTIFSTLTLTGCGEKPTHLTNLIPGKVVKISCRFDGDGSLYETTDPKWIADYIHAIDAVSLTQERFPEQVTGASAYFFWDENGKQLGSVAMTDPRTIWVNQKAYDMDAEPDFQNVPILITEKNEVKGK